MKKAKKLTFTKKQIDIKVQSKMPTKKKVKKERKRENIYFTFNQTIQHKNKLGRSSLDSSLGNALARRVETLFTGCLFVPSV